MNERLGQAIRLGELVPIGIQGDGAFFGVRVAVASDAATQHEVRHTVVTSVGRGARCAWTRRAAFAPDALPDFLVVIVPSDRSETFRTDEVTFDPQVSRQRPLMAAP